MRSLPEHPAEIAGAIAREVAGLRGLELCVLFGSAAEGRLRPDSDVDVAWLGSASGEEEAAMRRRLEKVLGRDVHLVDLRFASELLRIEVVRSGRLCFESRPGAYTTFAAESMSRWLDVAPAIQACAEAVRQRVLRVTEGDRG